MKICGYSSTTFRDAIDRARKALLPALKEKWWNNLERPKPLNNPNYANIALLIDSTSIEVYRPTGKFQESKRYWDGKNKIYALKKEVAVMATDPHYALFTCSYEIGSTHDYNIHKRVYDRYPLFKENSRRKNINSK